MYVYVVTNAMQPVACFTVKWEMVRFLKGVTILPTVGVWRFKDGSGDAPTFMDIDKLLEEK